jgi:cobalt-zinc-cadmium efflux system membrane fusion protein
LAKNISASQPGTSSAGRILIGLAILGWAAASLNTAGADAELALRLDERQIKAAGITTVAISQERAELELSLPGTVVIPPQQVRVVAAPANGMVESMLVAADEQVTEGQPIARLRSPELVEAQRQFLSAVADEALAADRLRRSQFLFEGKATPERELRVAQTQAINAKSQLDERQQILRLMEMSESEIETVRTTRKLFPAVTIHAPIAGTVTKRHVSPGERVAAAAPIYSIAELNPVWVNVQVPTARLGAIEQGETVFLPAYGVQGRIIRIARTVDAQTQSAIAVAEIDSNGGSVRPGLAVSAIIRIPQGNGAEWSVPSASVVRHNDRAWVFVRSADGFIARPVRVIAEPPGRTFIRAELSSRDHVADRGVIALLAELAAADKE